jgi:hypothetical protein
MEPVLNVKYTWRFAMGKHYYEVFDKTTTKQVRRLFNIGDIFKNQIQCGKCNDVITSNSRHDFKWCSCKSVAVDGGSWYLKRNMQEPDDYVELSEMYDDADTT